MVVMLDDTSCRIVAVSRGIWSRNPLSSRQFTNADDDVALPILLCYAMLNNVQQITCCPVAVQYLQIIQ
jgi:hypothetical protein